MTMNDGNRIIENIRMRLRTIDAKTDDLLEIADILEAHQVNVRHDGRWLNPASAIRTKVDIIFDEAEMIHHIVRQAVEDDGE